MMVTSSSADWLTMDAHFPVTMRHADRRVSTIMSMVLPFTSDDSAVMPRIGWMISTAMEKKMKMMFEIVSPASSEEAAAPAESRITPRMIWSVRNTPTKAFVRMPCRSSFTSMGERRSGKSVRNSTFIGLIGPTGLISLQWAAEAGWRGRVGFSRGWRGCR